MTTNVRIDPETKYRSPWIEGYASKTSVRPGETISIHVSTNPAIAVHARDLSAGLLPGPRRTVHDEDRAVQGDRPARPAHRPQAAARMHVGSLHLDHDPRRLDQRRLPGQADGRAREAPELRHLRGPRRSQGRPLFQVSDTTWNAYNRWPSQYSLYDDGKKVWYWGPNVQTSFDRPYGKYCQILDAPLSVGSGEFLLWEFPLAYWMEQHGYDVTYISNLDTHSDPASLTPRQGMALRGP